MIRFCLVWAVAGVGGMMAMGSEKRVLQQQTSPGDGTDALVSYVSLYSTPEGQLAAGMELLNSNFDLSSSQLYTDSSLLHQQLAAAIDLIAQVIATVLEDEIFSREYQLEVLRQEIEEAAVQVNDLTGACTQHSSCATCGQDIGCVWCSSLGRCVTGNSYGPLHSECTDFLYSDCPSVACSAYPSCIACLTDTSCAWCEGTGLCANTGEITCDESFLFVERKGAACPITEEQENAAFSTNTPQNVRNSRVDELQGQLLALEASAAKFRDQINVLEAALAQILASQAVSRSLALSTDYTFSDLQGLADSVELEAQSEEAVRRGGMGSVMEDTAKMVAEQVLSYVKEVNDQRVQQIASDVLTFQQTQQTTPNSST